MLSVQLGQAGGDTAAAGMAACTAVADMAAAAAAG